MILVVEDDPGDQHLIEAAFREVGVADRIRIVSDGAEAIDYMCGHGKFADRQHFPYPTFVMTDLKMPKVDGFGVLQFLKKNPLWQVVPTVVLSASEDPDDIKKSYMLGASAYHVKPHAYGDLRRQLKVLHDYWASSEAPAVDLTGKQLPTDSRGKLGERFPQQQNGKEHPDA